MRRKPTLEDIMTPEGIRSIRAELGLTQAELARVLGYGSRVRVTELESGTTTPSPAVQRLLLAYLEGYRPRDWPARPGVISVSVGT